MSQNTSAEPFNQYLDQLILTKCPALAAGKLSAVLIGSAADHRCDAHSDWDIHVFVRDIELSEIVPSCGSRPFIDDQIHDPPVFILIRNFDYLDRQFGLTPILTLWIYQHNIVLRDDDGAFSSYLFSRQHEFTRRLRSQTVRAYVTLRSTRHSLDAACRRNDRSTVQLLSAQTVIQGVQLLHLLYEMPYPKAQWLMWSLSHHVLRNDFASQIQAASNDLLCASVAVAPRQSRRFVGLIVDVMVASGFDRHSLDEWWGLID